MLLTVGHGTLSQEGLTELLRGAGVTRVVDVRRHPGSRRHPHVARSQMSEWLPAAEISYRWEQRLGGRRTPDPSSEHVAIRNDSFRAYADHLDTTGFRDALRDVLTEVDADPEAGVVVLCAETLWWRCHRRLIADAAVALHDREVHHLMHDGKLPIHRLTDGLRVADDRLVYDQLVAPGDQTAR